jgi:hypothetical protein
MENRAATAGADHRRLFLKSVFLHHIEHTPLEFLR